jgi:iron complex outermembrane recepter protein
LFSRQERSRLELAQPRSKFTFGVTYRLNKFSANVRVTRYGQVSIYNPSTTALDETYSPKVVTDLNVSYKITKAISIVAGANNIFDVYPDRIRHTAYATPYSAAAPQDNSSFGRLDYSLSVTQFGFTGGYYFAGITARF